MPLPSRRAFLAGGALTLLSGLYVSDRGLRFPRLTLSPHARDELIELPGVSVKAAGAIPTPAAAHQFRAIQPEPSLELVLTRTQLELTVSNISTQAQLRVEQGFIGTLDEHINGLNRTVSIESAGAQPLQLEWHLPNNNAYKVAAIGDTGGGDELKWCLSKAYREDADFFFHLGDFNYGAGEYDNAIRLFDESLIPTYISIGNHDFNDGGLLFEHFLNRLGRFNHRFTLAGTEFINFDTAADFLPIRGGQRGEFFRKLSNASGPRLAFTHRPLEDIRPNKDHALGSEAETQWIKNVLQTQGVSDYIAGHVHKSGETEIENLRQWTVGEGLGYEDLVSRSPISKFLMIDVSPNEQPVLTWTDLDMPWHYHTSHKHLQKLKKEQSAEAVEWYQQLRRGFEHSQT
ncbi:MAG: metallophosphoesterase [Pseudomonadota bacterium]